jgi:histidyl-tRNA synthetase
MRRATEKYRQKAASKLTAVKGMNDICRPSRRNGSGSRQRGARRDGAVYAYRNIRTPDCGAHAAVRARHRRVTDIVEKEMYSFEDRLNGEHLTLRPENTAGVVRAAIEHNLTCTTVASACITWADVPPRAPAARPLPPVLPGGCRGAGLWRARGRRRADRAGRGPVARAGPAGMCGWNSTAWASPTSGAAPRRADRLFRAHRELLDEDAQRRLHSNPLRILDTKNPAMQAW